jgi:hypothetical protein
VKADSGFKNQNADDRASYRRRKQFQKSNADDHGGESKTIKETRTNCSELQHRHN